MTGMLQHALDYARKGYAVMPCLPLSKAPATVHGVLDATTDEGQIEAWWKRHPKANIAISTAGLVVVDVDPGGQEWYREHFKLLATAPVQKTPRGGTHHLFRQNGTEHRNTSGKLGEGVDTRADGGYIVAAPSSVTQANGAAQPYVLMAPLPAVVDLPAVSSELDELLTAARSADYKRSESGKVKTNGRHDWLLENARSMSELRVPRHLAGNILHILNQNACEPPIERDVEREFQRMVDWSYGAEAQGLPAGVAPEIDQFVEDFNLRHLRWDSLDGTDERLAALRMAKNSREQERMPDELIDELPDVAQAAFDFYQAQAWRIQPELWLGSFIALTGSLIGHRLVSPAGTRSNVFCIGIGGTGSGKDATRTWCKLLLDRFGKSAMCNNGRVTSMSSILTTLSDTNPVCLLPDEFGLLLTQAAGSSKDNRYAETIIHGLLELYSSSSDPNYHSTAYADKRRRLDPIPYPSVSIWGVTPPGSLWQRLSESAIEQGLIPRFLYFQAWDEQAESVPDVSLEPAPILIEWCQRWLAEPKALLEHNQRMGAVAQVKPEAGQQLAEFRRHCHHLIDESDARSLIWSRAAQNASKLALIRSSWDHGLEDELPTVTASAMSWGISVASYSCGLVLRQMDEFLVDNERDRVCQKFLRLLDRHANEEGWCFRSQITKSLGLSKSEFAIGLLLRAGEVEETKLAPVGRRKKPVRAFRRI